MVCCSSDSRCTPSPLKVVKEILESWGYKGSLPDACAVCQVPTEFCICSNPCGNCDQATYRECYITGCKKPGKACHGDESRIARGELLKWVQANKEVLMNRQKSSWNRCGRAASFPHWNKKGSLVPLGPLVGGASFCLACLLFFGRAVVPAGT